MALFNLARMTTATTGNGATLTLGSAVPGFLTFALAGVTDGTTVSYGIIDGVNSETGTGVYTSAGTTLARNVVKSTAADARISLSGNAHVSVTALAQDFGGKFTASATAPATPGVGDHWYDLTTGVLSIYVNDGNSSQWVQISGGVLYAVVIPPQGRLTLTSGTPVMTASVTNSNFTYYTPYVGNLVPIYNGAVFVMLPFAELSNQNNLAGTAGPAVVAANSCYDFFVWSNAGTPTLTRGPAWVGPGAGIGAAANRGTGAGTTELVRVNGIWLNAQAITGGPAAQRGTYVGTIATNATLGTNYIFGGSVIPSFFGVWNTYNRVNLTALCLENSSWTYTGAAFRNSKGTNNVRHTFVSGLAEDGISTAVQQRCICASYVQLGIGLEGGVWYTALTSGFSGNICCSCLANFPPQLGAHYAQAFEASDGTNTVTYIGDASHQFTFNWRA